MKHRLSLSFVTLLLSLPSCSKDDSQLIVVLQSDYDVPREMGRIDVRIEDEDGDERASYRFDLGARSDLPLSFGLAPPDGDREAAAVIIVTPAGQGISNYPPIRRYVAAFPEGWHSLTISITRACASVQCVGEQTCLLDQCRPEDVADEDLRPVDNVGDELVNVCIPGAQRCSSDHKAVEKCVASGQAPERIACPDGRMCLDALGRCMAPDEIFHEVQATVSGSGRLESNPDGIVCAEGADSGCSASFLEGTQLSLTAVPNSGNRLAAWGGACSGQNVMTSCIVDVNQALTVSAQFENIPDVPMFELFLGLSGAGEGSILINDGVSTCPNDCNIRFPAGTVVNLRPSPAVGSEFRSWLGDCPVAAEDCSIRMDADKSAIASFEPTGGHSLEVSLLGRGGVVRSRMPGTIDCWSDAAAATCSATFADPTDITLEAIPDDTDSRIIWRNQPVCPEGAAECTINVSGSVLLEVAFLSPDPSRFDVTGDGFDDLVIGAPGFDNASTADAGRVYVFPGPHTGAQTIPAETAPIQYTGAGVAGLGSRSGQALAIGDVSGDGISDIIIGSPGVNSITVITGGALPPSGSALTVGRTIVGPPMSNFGAALTVLRDVNNDGIPDLAVGAPGNETVYVFFGGNSLLAAMMAGAADVTLSTNSPAGPSGFGATLASIGDFDFNGGNDLLVAAPDANANNNVNTGRVYLFGPDSNGWASGMNISAASASVMTGQRNGDRIGFSMAGLGDFDNNGTPDFAIGTQSTDQVGIFLATSADPGGLPPSFSSADRLIQSVGAFGASLAGVGDVTGDGGGDLLVGAPADGGPMQGAAHVLNAVADSVGFYASYTADCSVTACLQEGLGVSVGPAGDVNVDTIPDIAIGSRFGGGGAGGVNRGRVVVFVGGNPNSLSSSAAHLIIVGEDQDNGELRVLPKNW